MADATLVIRVVSDTLKAQAGLAATDDSVSRVQKGLGKMAVPAAVAVGAIAAFGASAVVAASKTEQAMGGIDAVFKENAAQVRKWSDESAQAVGLSKSTYGELATVIGSQLKNAGTPMDELAGKTNDLIGLGADLAAQFGGSTSQAVEALSSALKGEMDPLEAYGASIKQADIAAQMAADGTDKLSGAQADAARQAALLELIQKKTADAHGANAREADTAAGQSQRLAAQYEDLQSSLGTALLPALSALAGLLSKVAAFATEHTTLFQVLIGIIGGFALAILALNVAVGVYTAVTTLAGSATVAAWVAALWPILLVVAAVAAVIGIVVLLWKKSELFRNVVTGVWNAIKAVVGSVASAVKTAWTASLNAIKSAFSTVVNWIKAAWNTVSDAIKSAVKTVKSVVVNTWDAIKSAIKAVIDWLGQAWAREIQGLKNIVSGLGSILSKPFDAMRSAIDWVIDKIGDLISKLSSIHVPKIDLPGPFSLPGGNAATANAAFRTPRVGSTALAGSRGSGGTTVIVNGALDPEATARQIDRILRGHNRRVGLRTP